LPVTEWGNYGIRTPSIALPYHTKPLSLKPRTREQRFEIFRLEAREEITGMIDRARHLIDM
jgi:hypothetical protein